MLCYQRDVNSNAHNRRSLYMLVNSDKKLSYRRQTARRISANAMANGVADLLKTRPCVTMTNLVVLR